MEVERARSHLLSLTAFAAISQCAQWITSQMAEQSQQPKPKKEIAHWTFAEEDKLLDYLIEHRNDVERGSFKGTHMQGALAAVQPLYEKGKKKDSTMVLQKWNTVSPSIVVSVVAQAVVVLTDYDQIMPVQGLI